MAGAPHVRVELGPQRIVVERLLESSNALAHFVRELVPGLVRSLR